MSPIQNVLFITLMFETCRNHNRKHTLDIYIQEGASDNNHSI